ncbi:MAG: glycerol-3-phosphate 1-O-acyltransferase PlsY [Alistipes sp.]|nr:glycerol-3-phosphate 1-O-acyltransferase PlsY [Alistipes sp.]
MILTYYIVSTLLIIAYLLGSIPSAVWIGKRYYGIDIREHGSKNAGTTNMLRVLGRRAAIPVFALDFLKGFVAVTIIDLVKYDDVFANAPNENWFYMLRFAALFCAVLGHIFPIFAGFRGGKGVATLVGGVVAVNAPLVLLCAGVWIIVLMVTHYVSLASMIAGVCYPIFTLTSPKVGHLPPFIIFSLVVAILLIYTHRKNIQRLKAGTESKIYVWKRKQQADVAAPNETEESIEEAIEELVEEFQEDNKEA